MSPETGDDYKLNRRKDYFERSVAAAAAILTAPLAISLAAMIKLEDGGPVFYTSKRIDKDGKLFNVLKLKSLHENADKDVSGNLNNS